MGIQTKYSRRNASWTPASDVRRLVLGTAAFAPEYAGLPGLPSADAMRLALEACRTGVMWFETAPSYHGAEAVLGRTVSWRPGVSVATKVAGNLTSSELRASLTHSKMSLGTSTLDAVLIHNATVSQLLGPVMDELREQQSYGDIDLVGATVYEEDEALAAIAAHCDIVEVPFNLLDQRMAKRVFPAALKANVAIWVRSVWLRGALAFNGKIPANEKMADAVLTAMNRLWCSDPTDLAHVALRFVLGYEAVTGVVIGPRTETELIHARYAAEKGRLGWLRQLMATTLPEYGPDIYDPRKWK